MENFTGRLSHWCYYIGVGNKPYELEKGITMDTIFDTDFNGDETVIIYCGGTIVYEGIVADIPTDIKRGTYDWYLLHDCEGACAVFIG